MKTTIRLTAVVLSLSLILTLCPASLAAQDIDTRQEASLGRAKNTPAVPATGRAETVDYSDHNMLASAYATGSPYRYEGNVDTGGTPGMACAYFARWDGPVAESLHPYPSEVSEVTYKSGLALSALVTDVVMIPHTDSDNTEDILKIKRAIVDYGAAYLSMQYVSTYMNTTTASYYMPPEHTLTANYGHAVTIVGWDDNYPRTKFKSGTQPKKDGAFIIKNSYGTSGVGGGYFYLSYEDKCLGRSYVLGNYEVRPTTAVFITGASAGEYDRNYQHDPYGNTASVGLPANAPDYYYMANIFTAKSSETITAAAFYTLTENVPYEVYIITGGKSSLTLPDITALGTPNASGTQSFSGYHTVRLNEGVSVTKDQKFAVVVKIANTTAYPVALEMDTGYEKSFSVSAGQSFISSGGQWQDIGATNRSNLCVKAFSVTSPATGTAEQEQDAASLTDEEGTLTITDNDVTGEQGADRYEFAPYNTPDDEPPTGGTGETEDGFIPGVRPEQHTLYYESDADFEEPPTGAGDLPAQFDLREAGIITSVKNQGKIGACWTFAAIASAECTRLLHTGEFVADVEIAQSRLFLPESGEMTLTATPVNPDMVKSYSWSIAGGDAAVTTYSNNGPECIVRRTSQTEGIVNISCTVTYHNGQTAQDTVTLVAANYSGEGTKENPYTVSTPKQLALLYYFAGSLSNGIYFAQANDIDLAGISNWTPIGTYYEGGAFEGHYDGRGHTVYNMTIQSTQPITENTGLGLFNCIEFGSIKNLSVVNASITINAKQGSGNYIIGLLAARVDGTPQKYAEIENCTASGTITVTLTGTGKTYTYAGGLCGMLQYTDLTACSFTGSITHTGGAWNETGGLIDYYLGGKMSRCYAHSTIRSSGQAQSAVSGMAGLVYVLVGVSLSDSYAVTTQTAVSAPNESDGAGLVGFVQNPSSIAIERCYTSAAISGMKSVKDAFASYWYDDVILRNCYYNSTLAENYSLSARMREPNKLDGLTQEMMTTKGNFKNWDFTSVWVIVPMQNDGFPIHRDPIAPATSADVSVPNTVYLPQKVALSVVFTPAHASPQQVEVSIPDNDYLSLSNGVLTAKKKGIATITISGAHFDTVARKIRVDQMRGDLDGNGTVDTTEAISVIISLLTGKIATYKDYYPLDVDRSVGDAFEASKEDITISDLLALKQYQAGVRTINP